MSVSSQVYVFLYTVAGGIAIAFIYDWFRLARRVIKTNNFIIQIQDLAFWLIVALLLFFLLFLTNDGEIRGYVFLGTIIGAALYFLLLSRLFMAISLFIVRIIARLLNILITVSLFPIKIVWKLSRGPVGNVGRKTRRFFASSARVIRNNTGKFFSIRKAIRKIRKKL